jgi:hypothetical protein
LAVSHGLSRIFAEIASMLPLPPKLVALSRAEHDRSGGGSLGKNGKSIFFSRSYGFFLNF